jgi:molybdopterin synthase catalytic subunit
VVDNEFDIQILETPLDLHKCYEFVVEPACGGINAFIGTVRQWNKGEEITHLDFECYEAMALSELKKIALDAKSKFDAHKICIHHRIGKVAITEIAVIITVACKHRKAAFQACEYIIDNLKEDVPIWKKEFLINGSYWVNSRP